MKLNLITLLLAAVAMVFSCNNTAKKPKEKTEVVKEQVKDTTATDTTKVEATDSAKVEATDSAKVEATKDKTVEKAEAPAEEKTEKKAEKKAMTK